MYWFFCLLSAYCIGRKISRVFDIRAQRMLTADMFYSQFGNLFSNVLCIFFRRSAASRIKKYIIRKTKIKHSEHDGLFIRKATVIFILNTNTSIICKPHLRHQNNFFPVSVLISTFMAVGKKKMYNPPCIFAAPVVYSWYT